MRERQRQLSIEPEKRLTREEYLRLLSEAKSMGKERTYLMIKLFVCTGLRISQLQELTVEQVEAGGASYPYGYTIRIPDLLRTELLDYAERKGIREGMLFRTSSGGMLNRSNLHHEIVAMSKPAQIAPEKCSAHSLRYLYQDTRMSIWESMSALVNESTEQMLAEEQAIIGWRQ